MNILFLSETFYPHGGGAELATYQYAKLLSQNGLSVIIVTNRFSSEPAYSKAQNMTIYRYPILKSNGKAESRIQDLNLKYQTLTRLDVSLSPSFMKLIKWADVVYIPRFWFSAIPIAKALRKHVVVHLHDLILNCPLSTLYDSSKNNVCQSTVCSQRCIFTFEKTFGRNLGSSLASTLLNSTVGTQFHRLVALSDRIICVSKAQKEVISKKFPNLRAKIRVVYNPLPEVLYTELSGDDFAFLGGENPIKGFQVLQQAITKVKNGTPLRLHATNFEHLPKPRKLQNNNQVVYYPRLDSVGLKEVYQKSKAIIIPSICPEPSPYALSESILKGRLVIASKIGGIPEMAEGCNGTFLFDPGDSQQLAKQIEAVASISLEKANRLAIQSRETFLNKFNLDETKTAFIGCFSEYSKP
jgi:glycosyltransferase involved in cell wall biosynthesis